MKDELHRRVTVTLRTLHAVSAIAAGIAVAMMLYGFNRAALAAAILLIFSNIVSAETLRAFVALQAKEPRR